MSCPGCVVTRRGGGLGRGDVVKESVELALGGCKGLGHGGRAEFAC